MVLQWSSNDQLFFPKDVPKGQGALAARTIYASDPDHLYDHFWNFRRRQTFGLVLGEWSGGRDFNWTRRQSLRYWPRACHSWRSITRSEALSRSTLAVTSPTGVIGWMTGRSV